MFRYQWVREIYVVWIAIGMRDIDYCNCSVWYHL